jgi:hypothetical protein
MYQFGFWGLIMSCVVVTGQIFRRDKIFLTILYFCLSSDYGARGVKIVLREKIMRRDFLYKSTSVRWFG